MYPWDVLGIEQTDDKKVIKKAYAQLIRQYRPDEYPDEFQEINQAYVFALKVKAEYVVNSSEVDSIELVNLNSHVDNIEVLEKEVQSKHLLDCQLQIENLAHQKFHIANNLEKWLCVEDLMTGLTMTERETVALYAFQKCYEVNSDSVKKNGVIHLTVKSLKYLNTIFNWTDNWVQYQFIFSPHCYRFNFDLIEGKSEFDTNHFTISPWRRLFAWGIDLVIVIMFYFFMINAFAFGFSLGGFFFCFMLYQLVSESFYKKRTLGCQIFKYQIINNSFMTPSIKQSLLRLFYFHIVLSPLYLDIFTQEKPPLIALISVFIIYPAYLLIFICGKRFMHDEMSFTQAVLLK